MEENKVTENINEPNVEENVEAPKEQTLSAEEQLAQMRLDMAKMKRSMDKAMSEASSYKKQLREKQSADEIALQEKAEKEAQREEQFQALLKENTVNKYSKGFLALGYPTDLAEQAATAQFEGDTDKLFEIQQKVMEQMKKNIKADLMKSMPVSNISNDSEVSMTQEEFDKLPFAQKVDFKNKHYELWKKFAYN